MENLIDINKLIKVRTYAHFRNLSHTYVYTLASQGKILMIEIDGVKFIQLTKEEQIKYKK
jgi:tricorn protease-like protein